jgi:hypothetical protein
MRSTVCGVLLVVLGAFPAYGQFVAPGGTIPVIANADGLNETRWRSDVSILNVNEADTSVVMLLLPEIRDGEAQYEGQVSSPIQLPGGRQLTYSNILLSVFGLRNTKGALTVISLDGAPLLVSSRTYTFAEEGGSYGQDIRGVLVANEAWTTGVRHDSLFRTNVGVFLPSDPIPATQFEVKVYSNDGTERGAGFFYFHEAGVQQRSLSAFGVSGLTDGYVVFSSSDPSLVWYAYASRVDQTTGDAVYRPAIGRQSDIP